MKRILSLVLVICMLAGAFPLAGYASTPDTDEVLFLDNGYIQLAVAKDNGGFEVQTLEGNRLIKSDNNKRLLYHSDEYDTSFISFQVDDGSKTKEYLFGGIYGGLGDKSRQGVSVSKDAAGSSITAVWGTGDLSFTVNFSLANGASAQNGMVLLGITVQNSGTPVSVKARVLLDTAFDNQDYGTYVVSQTGGNIINVSTEQILSGAQYTGCLTNLYSVDNASNSTVTSYIVNIDEPYQIALGHWNNLASSLFAFSPELTVDFTDFRNEYMTADSACALYFDMGSIAKDGSESVNTYYGVYSNKDVPTSDNIAVNVSAPLLLEMNDDGTDYVRLSGVGIADFSVEVTMENYTSDSAKTLDNIKLAVTSTSRLRSLSDNGTAISGVEFSTVDPFTIDYTDVAVGQVIKKSLYFEADPQVSTSYEKISIAVYDTSSSGGSLLAENKIGEKDIYILVPGSSGELPKVGFTDMTPSIIYSSGTRHLFVSVTNEKMLADKSKWSVTAVSSDGSGVAIPTEDISITDGVMDVTVEDDIKLAAGAWQLRLDWTQDAVDSGIIPASLQQQTAEVMRFTVSDDKKYKNDTYGILAVVEHDSGSGSQKTYNYVIETFKDEAELTAFTNTSGAYDEILLVIRGEFTETKGLDSTAGHMGTQYTAKSTKTLNADRNYVIDNTVTINNCLDFENGTMTVYYEEYDNADKAQVLGSAVCVEFDGDLYTSVERTSVWEGKAALTKMEQGTAYSLIPYDENGNRDEDFDDDTITLIWPSVYGVGQTLAGMFFKLAYGELGVMYENYGESDQKEIGRVVSFSASMDLSFTGLSGNEGGKAKDFWSDQVQVWANWREDMSLLSYNPTAIPSNRSRRTWVASDDLKAQSEDDGDEKKASASVMVEDILFGCGEGFVGVNFEVGVGLENLIEALPGIEASIAVNTVNDWAFDIEGSFELANMKLDASLSIKSHDNIPVPDSFEIFFSGFKPGVNIDGFGVIWITGGGGGFSDLYETIFLTDALPPLKIIMSVSFNILQVLYCEKASLSLGATGISVTAENISVLGVDSLTIIPKASFGFEWYPGIDLQAAITVNMFAGTISGGGYIVLVSPDYKEVFFEAFARAQVNIPDDIPVIGGKTMAGVDLGINSEKLWGQLELLKIKLGLTYYWGESGVDFGTGSMAEPTYPDLLGQEDIPVYYDEENDRILYMKVGTNLNLLASSTEGDDGMELLGSSATLHSSYDKKSHQFNLGDTVPSGGRIVQITYPASSKEEAKQIAGQISIKDSSDNDLQLVFGPEYEGNTYGLTAGTDAQANANVSYDASAGTGTLGFTATESTVYGKDWTIATPVKADILIYGVDPLPVVSTVSASVSGQNVSVSWDGSDLQKLDTISFYLCEKGEAPADGKYDESYIGYELGQLTSSADITAKAKSFSAPADMPTGEYYLRAVYNREDEVNGVVYSSSKITVTNANTPADCSVSAAPSGDLKYKLTISGAGTNTTGYLVNIYDAQGNTTDFSSIAVEKASSGNTITEVGGSFTSVDSSGNKVSCALEAGIAYSIGVTPYYEDTASGVRLYGKETKVSPAVLPVPDTPEISVSASKIKQVITLTENKQTISRDAYTDADVQFTFTSDQTVSGSYSIDGETEVSFSNTKTITVSSSKEFTNGTHTISINGSNASGDKFGKDYVFVIDNVAPRLVLSKPLNGSFISSSGTLNIEGMSDNGALLTVTAEGTVLCSKQEIQTDASGIFSEVLMIPDYQSRDTWDIEISVEDVLGNKTSETVTVNSGRYARIKSLSLLVNDEVCTSGNISLASQGSINVSLKLMGITDDGSFELDDSHAVFNVTAAEGSADLENGILTLSADAKGFVTAGYEISNGYYLNASLCFGTHETVQVSGGDDSGSGSGIVSTIYNFDVVVAESGDVESVSIPAAADPSRYVPYYFKGGKKTYVQFSTVKDGKLVFIAPADANYYFEERSATYTDLAGNWAEKQIEEAVARGIITGTSDTTMSPGMPMSRAMLVTVLYRLAGSPAVTGSASFTDAAKDSWYSTALAWAEAIGIAKGMDDGSFAPDTDLTREQMCTFLVRFIEVMGYELAMQGKEIIFNDEDSISSWASDYIDYCCGSGLINGKEGNLFDPKADSSRAENIVVIMRMIDSIIAYKMEGKK